MLLFSYLSDADTILLFNYFTYSTLTRKSPPYSKGSFASSRPELIMKATALAKMTRL